MKGSKIHVAIVEQVLEDYFLHRTECKGHKIEVHVGNILTLLENEGLLQLEYDKKTHNQFYIRTVDKPKGRHRYITKDYIE